MKLLVRHGIRSRHHPAPAELAGRVPVGSRRAVSGLRTSDRAAWALDFTPAARRAFSVIELVGVMAVIAIMMAVIASSVFKNLRETEREAESMSQAGLCEALRMNIVRLQRVPSASNLLQVLQEEMYLGQHNLSETRTRALRRFVFDPNFRVGPALLPLPYVQRNTGSQQPINARLLIVSSLLGDLPSDDTIAANFQQVWDTPLNGVPACFPSGWTDKGEDIRIQRLDLAPLFHRLVLNNLDMNTNALYSIENTNQVLLIPALARVEVWFLHNTAVNLHYASRAVQLWEYLSEDASYVFENGRWGRYMVFGRSQSGSNFGSVVDAFLAAPEPPNPKFGASKQAIVDEMFHYMWNYGAWSDTGFETGGGTSDQQVPTYRVLEDARDRLGDVSYNLLQ